MPIGDPKKNNKAKKPYAKSHQEFIGNPGMQGGKTAKAKAEYEKARKGGAEKAAAKIAKPIKIGTEPEYFFLQDGARAQSNATKNVYKASGKSKNVIKQNILTDKSKTAMRAKIVEMNAVKKNMKKMGKKK